MKETPAGTGGPDGIAEAPPGPGATPESTGGNPGVWDAGTETGVPCCITTDPGGDGPPGGKNTWEMGPGDMKGLTLAMLKGNRVKDSQQRGKTGQCEATTHQHTLTHQ